MPHDRRLYFNVFLIELGTKKFEPCFSFSVLTLPIKTSREPLHSASRNNFYCNCWVITSISQHTFIFLNFLSIENSRIECEIACIMCSGCQCIRFDKIESLQHLNFARPPPFVKQNVFIFYKIALNKSFFGFVSASIITRWNISVILFNSECWLNI